MLEYQGEHGRRRCRSLRHSDFARGKEAADDLAASLRKTEVRPTEDLTLRALFEKYESEVTTEKRPAKQCHDRAARALFEQCWGPGALVVDLDKTHWDKFVRQRRSGALKPAGWKGKKKAEGKGVRNRMIQYDLKFLMAVCNWAVNVIEQRRPLLERNPFRNCPMPKEESPCRPRVSEVEYTALSKAAKQLGAQVELFLYLCHETGHRSKSVSCLRWSDIDLTERTIVWRSEFDKMKREHRTPLTQANVEVLKRARRESARIGDGWLFPSPEIPDRPISRREIARWWARLEQMAELPRIKGRGWHALRRKFADDNDDLPLSQLMAGGGWKSGKTIVETYQAPDLDKLRVALEKRAEKCAARLVAATTTTNYDQNFGETTEELLQVAAPN
jgi:integrase